MLSRSIVPWVCRFYRACVVVCKAFAQMQQASGDSGHQMISQLGALKPHCCPIGIVADSHPLTLLASLHVDAC